MRLCRLHKNDPEGKGMSRSKHQISIFNIFNSLQSSGTLDTKQAIGSTGQVYLTIPDKGIGKVTISFQNRLREFDATSFEGEELKTGQPIKVVRVDGNILVVQKN